MFSSLKIKNFRIYWIGMFVSLIGSWIQSTAQSWLVFELTRSAFLLGLAGFLGLIPISFLSLFAGVLADRIDKRTILIYTQTIFMLLAFLLAVLTQFKLITATQIMFIAFSNGTVMAFDGPSRQALIAQLVGREKILNAVALNSAAFNSARIVGPALAAILISVVGMSGCFYINGVSFLAVIFSLWLIRAADRNTARNTRVKVMAELRQGLSFIKRDPLLLGLIYISAAISFFGISYVILMPAFADRVVKAGAKGLGLLMSAAGAGALGGALFLARMEDLRDKGRLLLRSCFLFSFFLVLFALSGSWLLSVISLFIIGGCAVTAVGLANAILQQSIPDEYRGRLMSVFMLTFVGVLPFGNLAAGVLASFLGICFTVALNGVICALFCLLLVIRYPQLKQA
jgi:MFS family permease